MLGTKKKEETLPVNEALLNRQMWMEQILRLLELATEEQLRVLYTAALYIV